MKTKQVVKSTTNRSTIETNRDGLIRADSKGHNLPEPSFDKIVKLADNLRLSGIEIRHKENIERLK